MSMQNQNSKIEAEQAPPAPEQGEGEDGVVSCLVQTRAALEQALPALPRDEVPSVRRYGTRGSTTRFIRR
jgi:hypothetical protein